MIPPVLEHMCTLGRTVFTKGAYNVNIIGIRNRNRKAGAFDDLIGLIYRDKYGTWIDQWWEATTDPMLYYLENPMNVEGTLILPPEQYQGLFKLGKHKGRYDALVQAAPVMVYRDGNRDEFLDLKGPLHEGYGLNLHYGDGQKASAGCQVIRKKNHFQTFMAIVHRSARTFGNQFTYTVLEQWW